jgi:thiamine pyrophosphate-dependent acetolactate synthase large subunit-like protein
MAKTAADVLIENVIDWKVDVVFGLPGASRNLRVTRPFASSIRATRTPKL